MKICSLCPSNAQMSRSLKSCNVPDYLVDLIVFKLVKNTIRSNYNVVKILSAVRLVRYLWLTNHTVIQTTQRLNLRFNITKSSANT